MIRIKKRVPPSHLLIVAFSFSLLLVGREHWVSPLFAQELQWTSVQHLPGYHDGALTPELIADGNRTVHAFNSAFVGQELAIVYSQWRLDRGWTVPVDILLPFRGENRMHGAFLDPAGVMHIVYFGGDDLDGDVFYSWAPALAAANAHAWSNPIVIGDKAITPDEAAIVGDDVGNLNVIYAGTVVGHGVYFVRSTDSGESWSEPLPIFLAYSQQLWPSQLQLYRESSGRLHAVWSLGDTTGNSRSITYAWFDPATERWSEPDVMAQAINVNEVDTARLIEYNQELFMIYHDGQPTTRHMFRSQDSGETWSGPVRLFPHVGSNGPASMVIDSDNTLHMFFGNRVGQPYTNVGTVSGIWHSVWQGDHWSEPYDIIISAPQQARYDPSFAKAVVSQGNVILATWRQDPGNPNVNGVWSTYTVVDTPELPVEVPPTVVNTATPAGTPASESVVPSTPQATVRPNLTNGVGENPMLVEESPSLPLIIGVIPVVVLVLVVTIWQSRRVTGR